MELEKNKWCFYLYKGQFQKQTNKNPINIFRALTEYTALMKQQ